MMKYHEAEVYEQTSRVKSLEQDGSDTLVELGESIFYPGGGGQPCDLGQLSAHGFKAEVIEVFKRGDRELHRLSSVRGSIKPGDDVEQHLDAGRRLALVRMHTGEHVLFKALQNVIKDIELDKISLEVKESRLYVKCKDLNWDRLGEAEAIANRVIWESRPVKTRLVKKDAAASMPELRIRLDRIKSDTIRIVEVEGFDTAACKGIHVKNTTQVGNILITGFNIVKGSYEIRFKTNARQELFELALAAREAASQLGVQPSRIHETITSLQQDLEAMKKQLRSLEAERLANISDDEKKEIGSITLITKTTDNFDQKQITQIAGRLSEDAKTIVAIANRQEGRTTLTLMASADLNIDAPKLLKETLAKFSGKGGGRGQFATGSAEAGAEEVITALKEKVMVLAPSLT